jgi:LCP family protein required for cell wall assembly
VRAVLLIALVLAVSIGGAVTYFYLSSRTVREAVGVIVSGTGTPEKAFPGKDNIDILIMGRDLDRDPHGRIVHTYGRTDVNMVAHVDFRNRRVNVLSIPRDTLVYIPGYPGKRRISYANAYGGSELAKDTIQQFLGVSPDYYILMNFDGFQKAIDAIGGLEVTVDKKLDYDDNWGGLHIHLQPGKQVLNGEQAMGFVRYRQSNDGDAESDFVRIGRQQSLLASAKRKLSSPGMIFKLPKALDAIREDMEGDLTPAQVMCLARFTGSLPQESAVRMETIPACGESKVFVRADMDATQELVRQMFLDNQQ